MSEKEKDNKKSVVDAKSVDSKAPAGGAGGVTASAALIHQCFGLLLKVISELSDEMARPLPVVEKQSAAQLESIATDLSSQITRFAVFLNARPEPDTIIPTSERLGNHLTACICSLRTLLSDASPTRQKMVCTHSLAHSLTVL